MPITSNWSASLRRKFQCLGLALAIVSNALSQYHHHNPWQLIKLSIGLFHLVGLASPDTTPLLRGSALPATPHSLAPNASDNQHDKRTTSSPSPPCHLPSSTAANLLPTASSCSLPLVIATSPSDPRQDNRLPSTNHALIDRTPFPSPNEIDPPSNAISPSSNGSIPLATSPLRRCAGGHITSRRHHIFMFLLLLFIHCQHCSTLTIRTCPTTSSSFINSTMVSKQIIRKNTSSANKATPPRKTSVAISNKASYSSSKAKIQTKLVTSAKTKSPAVTTGISYAQVTASPPRQLFKNSPPEETVTDVSMKEVTGTVDSPPPETEAPTQNGSPPSPKNTAAARYHQKVKSGSLGIDATARSEAKANSYPVFSPEPLPPKTAEEVAAAPRPFQKTQDDNQPKIDSPPRASKLNASASDFSPAAETKSSVPSEIDLTSCASGSSDSDDVVSVTKNATISYAESRKARLEKIEVYSSDDSTAPSTTVLSSDSTSCSDPSMKADIAKLDAASSRLKSFQANNTSPTLPTTSTPSKTSTSPSTTKPTPQNSSTKSVNFGSTVKTSDGTGQPVPRSTTNQPQVTGGSFFRPKLFNPTPKPSEINNHPNPSTNTNSPNATSHTQPTSTSNLPSSAAIPSNQATTTTPISSPTSSSSPPTPPQYDPPPRTYARKNAVNTVFYYSGRAIEDKLIQLCRKSTDLLNCPSHHIFSPFSLTFNENKTEMHIVNGNNEFCGVMGPKPSSVLPGSEHYLPLDKYKVKSDWITSFHYSIMTIAQYLQILAWADDNSESSPAHFCQSPFRLETDDSNCLVLLNKDSTVVTSLPYPATIDDPTKPWDYPLDKMDTTDEFTTTADDMDTSHEQLTPAPHTQAPASTPTQPSPPTAPSNKPPGTVPKYKKRQPTLHHFGTPPTKAPTTLTPPAATKPSSTSPATQALHATQSPTNQAFNATQPPVVQPTVTQAFHATQPPPAHTPTSHAPTSNNPTVSTHAQVSPSASSSPPNTTTPSLPLPPSNLKQSSFSTPSQNHLPPIQVTPVSKSLLEGLGDTPINKSGEKLYVVLKVPPVHNEHPCVFLHAGVRVFAEIAARFDPSLELHPLFSKDAKIVPILANNPHAFPVDYEHLLPYIDVPNERSMTLATGNYPSGEKRKQGAVYCTLSIKSHIDPKFLVKMLIPVLDRRNMSLTVKPLQRVRTVTHWALGAASADCDPDGILMILKMAMEEELSRAHPNSKLAMIDEVPDCAVVMKVLRIPSFSKNNSVTKLESYSTSLRRAPHIECPQYASDDMDVILRAVENSRILQNRLGCRTHVLFLDQDRLNKAGKAELHNKIEGHMGWAANVASCEAPEIINLFRKVPVQMAPRSDGTKPNRPWKFTSVHREITSFMGDDGKQLIQSMAPILSGPKEGYTTLIFRNCEAAEAFAISFSRNPTAFIFHVLTKEKGYREDAVINLLKSCDLVARGKVSATTWDSEYWTVDSPYASISDTFVDDLANDGYVLTDKDKVSTPTVSTIVATADVAMLQAHLGKHMKDDATLATTDGVSVLSDATHATQGDSSVRSTNTQDFHRNLESQCIAAAQAMESAAAARWSAPPTAGSHQGSNQPTSSAAPTHPATPLPPHHSSPPSPSTTPVTASSTAPPSSTTAPPGPSPSNAPTTSTSNQASNVVLADRDRASHHTTAPAGTDLQNCYDGLAPPPPQPTQAPPAPASSHSPSATDTKTTQSTPGSHAPNFTPPPTHAPPGAPSTSSTNHNELPNGSDPTLISTFPSFSPPEISAPAASSTNHTTLPPSHQVNTSVTQPSNGTSSAATHISGVATGEPASITLRGLGNNPSVPDTVEGAGGPRGPQ